LIYCVLQRKLHNSVLDVCHHFQISEMKVYKTYEGHITQFCCFEAQKVSRKTGNESDPNFLYSKYCLGLWPLSQFSEVQKLQDRCCWQEDLIFYNFSRNRDIWICTFPTSNLARNVWVGKNSNQKRKLFQRGKKATI
jgi:hypothetical protein